MAQKALKAKIGGVVTPVYSNENAVMVSDPTSTSGAMITLKERLDKFGGSGFEVISAAAYNEKAKNGQLVTNKVYFVEEG